MQIKQFYLDLKEWPQYAKKNKWNVWLLESEAFSEPLRFTFKFENEDIIDFKKIEESCRDYYDSILKKENTFNNIIDGIIEKEKMITKSYQEIKDLKEKYDDLYSSLKKREKNLKQLEERENQKIQELEKQIQQMNKKIDLPQPQKIYSNKWEEFICWTDLYYWSLYSIPSGDYCILEQYEYEPQNEYVYNEDQIIIYQKHLSQGYRPEIQLISSNALDKPVSKVRLTVLFFQI